MIQEKIRLKGEDESVLALARARGFDKCPICLMLAIEDAVITNCGHRFCEDCLKEHEISSDKCPVCKSPLAGTVRCTHIFRKTAQFMCPGEECTNKNLTLSEFADHVQFECPSRLIECRCKELVAASQYQSHVSKHEECKLCSLPVYDQSHLECPDRSMTCSFCKESFLQKNEREHTLHCEERIDSCDVCGYRSKILDLTDHKKNCFLSPCDRCDLVFVRQKYNDHLKNCREQQIECPVTECRIVFRVATLDELKEHMATIHRPPYYIDIGLYGSASDTLYIVRDTLDRECLAHVEQTRQQDDGSEYVLIAFVGWSPQWNEWIPATSDRIQPLTKAKITDIKANGSQYARLCSHFEDAQLKIDVQQGKLSRKDIEMLMMIAKVVHDFDLQQECPRFY